MMKYKTLATDISTHVLDEADNSVAVCHGYDKDATAEKIAVLLNGQDDLAARMLTVWEAFPGRSGAEAEWNGWLYRWQKVLDAARTRVGG